MASRYEKDITHFHAVSNWTFHLRDKQHSSSCQSKVHHACYLKLGPGCYARIYMYAYNVQDV